MNSKLFLSELRQPGLTQSHSLPMLAVAVSGAAYLLSMSDLDSGQARIRPACGPNELSLPARASCRVPPGRFFITAQPCLTEVVATRLLISIRHCMRRMSSSR